MSAIESSSEHGGTGGKIRRGHLSLVAGTSRPILTRVDAESQARVGGVYNRAVKPILDRVVGGVALAVLAVPLGIVGLMIVVSMGGPVLFRQQRVGLNGEAFTVLKFRTMRHDRRVQTVDVENDRRQTHKSADDPRHTRVGRFLRKWGIDELPQLINVVRGEMSIVGPRPELCDVVEQYIDPEMHDRHLVRPGLTGLWQISARGDGLMHENAEWDLEYLRQMSFRRDVSIVLQTPFAMLNGRTGE